MPNVVLAARTYRAIRALGDGVDWPNIPANVDGTFTVWLADDTLAFAQSVAFPGESLDDTVQRMIAFYVHGGKWH